MFSWCYLVVRLDCLCCALVWCCLLWLGCIVWFFVVFVVFWLAGLVVLGDGWCGWLVAWLVVCVCVYCILVGFDVVCFTWFWRVFNSVVVVFLDLYDFV